jgi:CBS domain-containing protein
MIKHHISRVLVMENGKLTGVLTKKDLGYRRKQDEAAWRRRSLDQNTVMDLATPDPVVVPPDLPIKEIAGLFIRKNISCVPVVENGRVEGIVTKTDLMKSTLVTGLSGTARGVMEDAVTVSRWHSLAHVVSLISTRADKAVVTNNDGSVAGVITETDLALHEAGRKHSGVTGYEVPINQREGGSKMGSDLQRNPAEITAEEIMTSPAITAEPDLPLPDAVALMRREQVNSLVILEKGTLVGIVKRDDIIKEVTK